MYQKLNPVNSQHFTVFNGFIEYSIITRYECAYDNRERHLGAKVIIADFVIKFWHLQLLTWIIELETKKLCPLFGTCDLLHISSVEREILFSTPLRKEKKLCSQWTVYKPVEGANYVG